MKAVSRILLVAALMISIGLHWAVLQSAAWVGMAVTYTVKTGSVVQGLSKTFDGRHPCRLCHAVDEGTSSEKPKDSAPAKTVKVLKIDLAMTSVPAFIFQASPKLEWPVFSQAASQRPLSPEPPPPRRGVAA